MKPNSAQRLVTFSKAQVCEFRRILSAFEDVAKVKGGQQEHRSMASTAAMVTTSGTTDLVCVAHSHSLKPLIAVSCCKHIATVLSCRSFVLLTLHHIMSKFE